MTYTIIAKLENDANTPVVEKITGRTEQQIEKLRNEYRASAPTGSILTVKVTAEK